MASALELQQQGEALFDAGDYVGAERLFQQAIDLDGGDANSYNWLGVALEKQKRSDEAIAAYAKSIELYGSTADRKYPLQNWGDILCDQDKWPEAESKYRDAIAADTSDAVTYNGLGLALAGQKRFDKAADAYAESIRLYGDATDRKYPLQNCGWMLADRYDHADAVEKFRAAVDADLSDADSWFGLGSALGEFKHYDDAYAALQRAIELKPEDPNAYHNKAYYLGQQGEYKYAWMSWRDACSRYKRRLEVDPRIDEFPEYSFWLGIILQGEFLERTKAEEYFKQALVSKTQGIAAQSQLVSLYQEQIDAGGTQAPVAQAKLSAILPKAVALLEERQAREDNPASMIALGDVYLYVSDFPKAEIWYRCAEEKIAMPRQEQDGKLPINFQEHGNIQWKLGVLYSKWSQIEKALPYFEGAIYYIRDNLALRSNLAETYLKLKRYDRAEQEFQRVLKVASGNVESLIGAGQLCIELAEAGDQERFEQAEKNLSEAIRVGALYELGSKKLAGAELAGLYYLRGYARTKCYESQGGRTRAQYLVAAKGDFKQSADLDGEQFKAQQALERVKARLGQHKRESLSEVYGPLAVCAAASSVFILAQKEFIDHGKDAFGGPGYYVLATFGALIFMIAGLYLPQILKLKVGSIELEKGSVDQISKPTSLGISR
jgi:tetratricopeptide (TPR) repeat protein